MMRRVVPLTAALALLFASPPGEAAVGRDADLVEAASAYLARAQGWYVGVTPTDLGQRRGVVRNGWEWERGRGLASPNIAAIAAGALLDAYEALGDERLLDHAVLHGMTLLNDFRGFRSLTTPYRQDVAFLARLSEVTGDPAYRDAAGAWFVNLKDISPTGADEVDRMFMARKGSTRTLVGYEVAFAIRAAVGVGDVRYASQLADAVWARRAQWSLRGPRRDTWDLTSKAALVSAFAALDADRYGPAIDQWVAELVSKQGADGSWAGSTQATAYALRALTDASIPKTGPATRNAAKWLKAGVGRDGAWSSTASSSRQNVEVQAEALTAYLAYSKTR